MKLPEANGKPLVDFSGDIIFNELIKKSAVKEFIANKGADVIEEAAKAAVKFMEPEPDPRQQPDLANESKKPLEKPVYDLDENDGFDDDDDVNDYVQSQPYTDADAMDVAEDYVMIIDAINQLSLPVLYFFIEFDGSERAIIKAQKKNFERCHNANMVNASDDDTINDVYTRWCDFKERCLEVPLSESEEQTLIKPLAKYAKKHRKKNSLGTAVAAAFLRVYSVRLMPLLNKYF